MSVAHTIPSSSTPPMMDRSMRRMAGRMLAIMGAVLLALLATLLVQINALSAAEGVSQRTLIFVLIGMAVLLVALAGVVIYRATVMWRQAKDGLIGTRLQTRILMMFCVVAVVPTVVLSLFAALFFNYGVTAWFDARVSSALEDSVTVATAYIEEHKNAIRTDALAIASDVQRQLPSLFENPTVFGRALTTQIGARNLTEAVLFDRNNVIARTELSFSLVFEKFPEEIMARADTGTVVVFGEDENKIQAVVKISSFPQLYLLVGRTVDPKVLTHMEAAKDTVLEYRKIHRDLRSIQQQFFAVFVLVALLLLLASIWAGMMLAVRLIGPMMRLMMATERVRAGDYSIKVPEGKPNDEIGNLGRTFNRMTSQLETQRQDLLAANRLLDERRRFTEAVLSGVSAGVIALDIEHRITLHNRTALSLLGVAEEQTISGRPLAELLPEVASLLREAEIRPERIAETNATIQRGETRVTLHVRVTAECFHDAIERYIVTLDDITVLVNAQRSAAWADVARRVAHEIKNPLTPITLSAERLRRKFIDEISDRDSYERYLDTISRHVNDIGRMVEEFVAFARLPAPMFRDENIIMLIRTSIFSEQTVHSTLTYTQRIPSHPITIRCDGAQLGQVFLNILKNAAEALESASIERKEISITLNETDQSISISIEDNGPGFPPDLIARVTEPYVTTRARGSGLGLAIAKKTIEDHKGTLQLANREEGGAIVTITLPRPRTE